MNIKKYPDGTSYVVEEDKVFTDKTFRINTYEDLWHLGQYIDLCNFNGAKPRITIPNLLDAQADRRFASNESSGLSLVCKFLNSFDAEYKIFHPHNPEVVEALLDNVEIIDNKDFISQVFGKLYYDGNTVTYKWNENLILMSSDAGGFKPLMKLCDKLNWQGETFSASKARMNDGKLEQRIDCDDFDGKDILIIDDISVYGGTFKGLAYSLNDKNIGKLYLAVSHMTIQDLGDDPITAYFDKVFTTNSKFDNYNIRGKQGFKSPKNLEIIKLF